MLTSQISFAQNYDQTLNLKTNKKLTEEINEYQVFYFWATWCPDCKEKLKSDLSTYQQKNISLATLSIEKDREKIQKFVEKNKLAYSVYFDPEKTLQKQFKIFSVPSVVLAKKSGTTFEVIESVVGTDWTAINLAISKIKQETK